MNDARAGSRPTPVVRRTSPGALSAAPVRASCGRGPTRRSDRRRRRPTPGVALWPVETANEKPVPSTGRRGGRRSLAVAVPSGPAVMSPRLTATAPGAAHVPVTRCKPCAGREAADGDPHGHVAALWTASAWPLAVVPLSQALAYDFAGLTVTSPHEMTAVGLADGPAWTSTEKPVAT